MMTRTTKQLINKETEDLKNTVKKKTNYKPTRPKDIHSTKTEYTYKHLHDVK